ncbi:hypothetical protein GQX74_004060 [Glossina fuscipes]|nr:hypothetical protein GQX74_004060 [Glossina fuscipes]
MTGDFLDNHTRALYNEDIRGCTYKSIYKLHNLPHFISCSSSSTARNTAELAKLPSGLLTCSATAILQRQKKDDYININLLRCVPNKLAIFRYFPQPFLRTKLSS